MTVDRVSREQRRAARRIRWRERLLGAAAVFCRNNDPGRWRSGAAILLYHRIAADAAADDDPFAVRESEFDRQVAWLAANRTVVTVGELAERLLAGTWVGGYAAISFDDGYDCTYSRALPILKRHAVPASVFVDTARIDGGRPALNSAEIRALAEEGVEIGSHSVSHVSLRGLSAEELRRELTESRALLEAITGGDVTGFAYPFGYFDGDTMEMVSATGYRYGCSCLQHRTNGPGDDPFALSRVEVNAGDRIDRFCRKLRGDYAGVYRAWYRVNPATRALAAAN